MPSQLNLLERTPPAWDRFGVGFVDPPAARLTDPETSHEAARNYQRDAETQNGQITAYLRGVGIKGATAKEIAEGLGWPSNVVVSRRIAALRRAGLVWTTSEEREGCRVHRAA